MPVRPMQVLASLLPSGGLVAGSPFASMPRFVAVDDGCQLTGGHRDALKSRELAKPAHTAFLATHIAPAMRAGRKTRCSAGVSQRGSRGASAHDRRPSCYFV